MILLADNGFEQGLADAEAGTSNALFISTLAGIIKQARRCEYPRTERVYTIRTPSLGGQPVPSRSGLPIFFSVRCLLLTGLSTWNHHTCGAFKLKQPFKEGCLKCLLERFRLHWWPVLASLLAAIQLASRRLAVLQSAPVQLFSPMMILARALPSVRLATSDTVRSTQHGVTDLQRTLLSQIAKPRSPLLRGFLRSAERFSLKLTCQRRTHNVQ